ncbi:DUF6329 domain-containing protein [Propionispora hippei]|uniref:DUF6329 domain-containing protein n=1 Tax=Propionispora hippei DSM 15287 TaxID=1123003 RepID=A0A1M6GJE8_9FIRM|nr:DUF6329 domain-containing protein [Propionispora hippei]SHJ10095.1 hypothetical protein SAMN02745170_01726 [Propionispora hippei DSM 15287]
MKALFGRKMVDIEELRDATRKAKKEGFVGSAYKVTKEVALSDIDFKEFTKDFLKDQPWIDKADGGSNPSGEIRCIRVLNLQTGASILVNSEGYNYPRYTAIEE